MNRAKEANQRLYRNRFERTAGYRNRVWQILTRHFFQAYISSDAVVLDLGCGYGEFINNIQAGRKLAMDLNPDAARHLSPGVEFLEQDCAAEWAVADASLDAVFTSNFFEHLPDKASLTRTLEQIYRRLRPGGRLIALGPNARYLGGRYWDFYDHHIVLTDASLAEALEMTGFALERAVPRFLPYTLVNAPEYPVFLVRLYLAIPLAWRIAGRQFLLVARKPSAPVNS